MKKNSYNEIGLIVNGENIIISILIAVLVFTLSLISYQIELFYKYENYLRTPNNTGCEKFWSIISKSPRPSNAA